MRSLIVLASALLALVSAPALAAPQDLTISFTLPTSGGAFTGACAALTPPTCGVRLFKDSALVGPLVSGQSVAALLNDDGTTHVLGIEPWNAGCGSAPLPTCQRANKSVTISAVVQPPGSLPTITIDAPCAKTTPATCVIVVN